MGYDEIPNSLAVEFDTILNEVAVHTRGIERNSSDPEYSLGSATAPVDLDDGSIHTAQIGYTPGTLSVSFDDLATPALTVSVDLLDTLDLDLGRAYVGFGSNAFDDRDILGWEFHNTVDVSCTFGIDNASLAEDAGDMNFTIVRLGNTSGTLTVDWATSDGTAVAGDDYTSASGHVTFLSGETEKPVTVPVTSDTVEEAHEIFHRQHPPLQRHNRGIH